MATHLLYQTAGYLSEFQSRVRSMDLENRLIELDQTAFYPGGGGQPCDFGMIEAGDVVYPVTRVRKMGDLVFHQVGGDAPLPEITTSVRGVLDWPRRFRLMRTHTALHILCGVVFRDYGALVTGGDMEPLQGRMDFEFESLHKDLVQVIEAAVNREVEAARKVNVSILPREQAFQIPDLIRTKINLLPEGIAHVRVVEIQGLDLQADGGTHVQDTTEVGAIRVVDYKSKGKINKRIYIQLQE